MLNIVSKIIGEGLLPLGKEGKPSDIQYLLYKADTNVEDKKVFFIFLNHKHTPDIIMLFIDCKARHNVLLAYQGMANFLKGYIPTAPFLIEDKYLMFFQYIPSEIFRAHPRRTKEALIRKSLGLLLEISVFWAGQKYRLWLKSEIEAEIKKDIDLFQTKNKNNGLLKNLEKDFHAILRLESLGRVPRIPQHGDFVICNLRFNKDKVYLFDFSEFSEVELPFYDFITLFYSCLLQEYRIKLSGVKKHFLYGLFSSFIKTYSEAIQVDEMFLVRMFPFLMLKWANRYYYLRHSKGMGVAVYQALDDYYRIIADNGKLFTGPG